MTTIYRRQRKPTNVGKYGVSTYPGRRLQCLAYAKTIFANFCYKRNFLAPDKTWSQDHLENTPEFDLLYLIYYNSYRPINEFTSWLTRLSVNEVLQMLVEETENRRKLIEVISYEDVICNPLLLKLAYDNAKIKYPSPPPSGNIISGPSTPRSPNYNDEMPKQIVLCVDYDLQKIIARDYEAKSSAIACMKKNNGLDAPPCMAVISNIPHSDEIKEARIIITDDVTLINDTFRCVIVLPSVEQLKLRKLYFSSYYLYLRSVCRKVRSALVLREGNGVLPCYRLVRVRKV